MHSGSEARSKLNLIEMFKPASAKIAAVNAANWLMPGSFDLDTESATLGRLGSLEVRLARKKGEIRRAQRLRYRVFYKDGRAIADAATMLAQRDKDAYDKICDHLLVIDHAAKPSLSGKLPVVGTYRLLRHDVAMRHGGFYTENEFDIAGMLERHPDLRFLELGRSCVLPRYRTKRTVELLWHGIWSYVRQNKFDAMIGCASFESTNPKALAQPLSFLHHFAAAPDDWRAAAKASRRVDMNLMAKEAVNTKAALRELPPLIKAYLRLGAYVGDGAVIDHQFGTTDVLIMMPVSKISERYIGYFGADATRHAA